MVPPTYSMVRLSKLDAKFRNGEERVLTIVDPVEPAAPAMKRPIWTVCMFCALNSIKRGGSEVGVWRRIVGRLDTYRATIRCISPNMTTETT